MKKITVAVPIFNAEEYLEKCVHSIIKQKYKELEVFLVDDGSTDRSGQIIDQLAKLDNRIRVFHQKNSGAASARNYALEHGTGDYYIGVDSDDFLDDNWIFDLVDQAEKNELDTVIGNNIQLRISEDNQVETNKRQLFAEEFVADTPLQKAVLMANACAARVNYYNDIECGDIGIVALRSMATPWDKLHSMSIIKNNNIRYKSQMKFGEDSLFTLEYLQHAKRIGYKFIYGYNYRILKNSLSHGEAARNIEDVNLVLKEMRSFCETIDCETSKDILNQAIYVRTIRDFMTCNGNKEILGVNEAIEKVDYRNLSDEEKTFVRSMEREKI